MSLAKNGWQIKTIGELGEIITGGTPTTKQPEYFGHIYPFITPSDIDGLTRYIKTTRFLSEKGKEDQLSKLLPNGAVCFVCIASVGKICMVREPSFTNQQINSIVVDKERNNNFFVYYLLRSMADEVKNIASGTAAPIVNKSLFSSINVTIPSQTIQNKIAAILSAYDNLIENNLRRIEILEEAAQALYREWFVHFRFPGHEKVRFVDSPLGKIPEGWDVKTVAELLAKVRRKKRVKRQDYQVKGPIPIVDQGKEEIGGYTNDINAAHKWPLPIIVFGDHTRVLKYVDFPFASGADGTQLLISNTPRMPILLFFHTLKAIDLSDYSYARHFKWLKEELVVVPSVETASSFSKKANLYIGLASKLRNINLILICTRDLLLPRLISGELDVSELDIDVSDVS